MAGAWENLKAYMIRALHPVPTSVKMSLDIIHEASTSIDEI